MSDEHKTQGLHLEETMVGGLPCITLTLERGKTNVMDLDTCKLMVQMLADISKNDSARVVILRGAGRCFSTGVDIEQHTVQTMPELLPAFHEIFHRLLELPAITIAAVHGFCLGGAAELALACDRVIIDSNTKIGFPEIKVGCYPPIALALLPERIGHARAMHMILSGEFVSPKTLLAWGGVDVLSDGSDVQAALDAAIAQELAAYEDKSPSMVGMVASLMHDRARAGWAKQIAHLEQHYLEQVLGHVDSNEGIEAFMQRRVPQWKKHEVGA